MKITNATESALRMESSLVVMVFKVKV